MIRCKTCQELLPADLEHFYKHERHEGKLRGECKACSRTRAKQAYERSVAAKNANPRRR